MNKKEQIVHKIIKPKDKSCESCIHCLGGWNDVYCEISGSPIYEDELKEKIDCSHYEFGI